MPEKFWRFLSHWRRVLGPRGIAVAVGALVIAGLGTAGTAYLLLVPPEDRLVFAPSRPTDRVAEAPPSAAPPQPEAPAPGSAQPETPAEAVPPVPLKRETFGITGTFPATAAAPAAPPGSAPAAPTALTPAPPRPPTALTREPERATGPQPAPRTPVAAEPAAVPPGPPANVLVQASQSPEGARIVLIWPSPVEVEQQVAGRELFLRFNRELRTPDLATLPKRLPDWLQGAVLGFDSILFQATRDVVFGVEHSRNMLTVTIMPAPAAAPLVPTLEAGPSARLRLLAARLKSQLGETFAAREELQQILARDHAPVDALLLMAEVEQRLGNWQSALELYDQALVRAPDNAGVISAQAALRRNRGVRISTRLTRQEFKAGDTQKIALSEGRMHPWMRGEIGFVTETRRVDAPEVRRPNGGTGRFDTTRVRTELFALHNFDDRALTAGGRLHFSPDSVGGAVSLDRRDGTATTRVRLEYGAPYWQLLEGLADGGVRDRVELIHERSFDPDFRINGRFGGSFNRYGIDGDADVASSLGAFLEMAYTVNQRRPFFSVAYTYNGLYVLGRERRVSAAGELFAPMGVATQEVHAGIANMAGEFTDYVRYLLFGGYSRDRITLIKGPQFGAEFAYEPTPDFELGLNYSKASSSGRGTEGETVRLGVFLNRRF